MKQFSLEEYLKNPSRKVVTRDGRKVRIICTDMKNKYYPIVALVESKSEEIENAKCYTEGGELYDNEPSTSDLFFAPKKHKGWINVYRNSDSGHTYTGAVYDSQEDAEKRIKFDEDYVTTIKIEWEE